MSEITPDYLKQGEPARLFPVLSNTSKEGRTTSVVLACLAKIDEFGAAILKKFDQRVGSRAQISTFTEIVCKTPSEEINDRPDGLIVLKTGRNEWRALVETKVGNNTLNAQQVERYRGLAKANDFDCVITISNQFATAADTHPLAEVRKSRSRIPVYHLSWMSILTEAELLIQNEGVGDVDQYTLLNELRRFLSHESAGVQGFDRMPSEWGD
ncbi:MAG: hypothetical protein OIF54_19160, partial [Cohaesibacter sp.]|nr:hypothetical protein [Cohaesibacter sp.]